MEALQAAKRLLAPHRTRVVAAYLPYKEGVIGYSPSDGYL